MPPSNDEFFQILVIKDNLHGFIAILRQIYKTIPKFGNYVANFFSVLTYI